MSRILTSNSVLERLNDFRHNPSYLHDPDCTGWSSPRHSHLRLGQYCDCFEYLVKYTYHKLKPNMCIRVNYITDCELIRK